MDVAARALSHPGSCPTSGSTSLRSTAGRAGALGGPDPGKALTHGVSVRNLAPAQAVIQTELDHHPLKRDATVTPECERGKYEILE